MERPSITKARHPRFLAALGMTDCHAGVATVFEWENPVPRSVVSTPSAVNPHSFRDLTNKNTCTILDIGGCPPSNLSRTRKWHRLTKNSRMDSCSPFPSGLHSITWEKPPNFTITRKMRHNATKCNKFTNNSPASPSDLLSTTRQGHVELGVATRNCTAQQVTQGSPSRK